MSNFNIADGTGSGDRAKVDGNNRLLTQSSVESNMARVSRVTGEAYTFSSDFISITSVDTETGILYIKNTSPTMSFCISSIRASGILAQKWKLYSNVTTGTLVSAESAMVPQNLNLTSNSVAPADVYVGVNGSTVTDGARMEEWINGPGGATEEFGGAILLGRNDIIALTVEVPVACSVSVRVIGYFG